MNNPYFESTYRFQLLKSSWGIYAQIAALVEPTESSQYKAEYRISEKIWFSFNGKVTASNEDKLLMINGLRFISQQIEKGLDEAILIALTDFQIAHSDYQKEGMFYAFAAWARHHFGLPSKEINCYFDKAKNKYIFPELDDDLKPTQRHKHTRND